MDNDNSCRKLAIIKVANITSLPEKKIEEYFDYLDELRVSGATNMFGGIPYLMQYDTKLERQHACAILLEWMDSYGK